MSAGRRRHGSVASVVAVIVLVAACSTTPDGEHVGPTGSTARPSGAAAATTVPGSMTAPEAPAGAASKTATAAPSPPADGASASEKPAGASSASAATDTASGDGFKSGPYVGFANTNELVTEADALAWWPYGLMRPASDFRFDHVSLIAGSGGTKRGRQNDPASDPCGIQLFYEKGYGTASDAPYLELLRAGSVLVTVGWLPPHESTQYVSYGKWGASARNKPVTVRGQAGAQGQYVESSVRQIMWDKPHNGGWLLWTVQVSMDRYTEEQTLDVANRLEEYGKRQ